MGILSWIVLGGIAGWLASIITKRNDQMRCIAPSVSLVRRVISKKVAV